MNRKRTNLDRAEADYLYANVLLEFNKYNSFQTLSIPERNDLISKKEVLHIAILNRKR